MTDLLNAEDIKKAVAACAGQSPGPEPEEPLFALHRRRDGIGH